MNKSSKAITLVLIGSAAGLAGYSVTHRSPPPSDFGPAETDFVNEVDANGQPTTRSYTSSSHSSGASSRYRSSPGWVFFGGSSSSGTRTGVGSSGGSRSSSSSGSSSSSSSSTSRGGFGSTGHAVSSSGS